MCLIRRPQASGAIMVMALVWQCGWVRVRSLRGSNSGEWLNTQHYNYSLIHGGRILAGIYQLLGEIREKRLL